MIQDRLDIYTNRTYTNLQNHDQQKFPGGKSIKPINDEMIIVIPTLGRETKQKVIYQFPEELKRVLYLVTRESHVSELSKHNSNFNIISLPDDTNGIAQTRQRCLEAFQSKKIWMMDDIIKLQKRSADYRVLGKATPAEVKELYDFISYMLDYFPQIGVSDRPGNNRVHSWLRYNQRSYTCYGLRTDILEDQKIKFSDMYDDDPQSIFYEDFYLTLALLTRGYPNAILYDWVSSHPGHQAKGGNSVYRTNDRQLYSAKALQKRFPDFVKVVQKEGSWGKGMEVRWDVAIKWKKAFESSQFSQEQGLLF